jgi:hypothetical protein
MGLLFAASLWLGESLVHFTILNHGQPFELIPSDSNELWMRAVICSMIVLFAIYMQKHENKKLDVEKEKMRTLKATMYTVEDRVGNALSGMRVLLGGVEANNQVNPETHQKLMLLLDEAYEHLRKISSIEEITERKILNDVYYLDIDEK